MNMKIKSETQKELKQVISESIQKHLKGSGLKHEDLVYAKSHELKSKKLKPEVVALLESVLDEVDSKFANVNRNKIADMISKSVNEI